MPNTIRLQVALAIIRIAKRMARAIAPSHLRNRIGL